MNSRTSADPNTYTREEQERNDTEAERKRQAEKSEYVKLNSGMKYRSLKSQAIARAYLPQGHHWMNELPNYRFTQYHNIIHPLPHEGYTHNT